MTLLDAIPDVLSQVKMKARPNRTCTRDFETNQHFVFAELVGLTILHDSLFVPLLTIHDLRFITILLITLFLLEELPKWASLVLASFHAHN